MMAKKIKATEEVKEEVTKEVKVQANHIAVNIAEFNVLWRELAESIDASAIAQQKVIEKQRELNDMFKGSLPIHIDKKGEEKEDKKEDKKESVKD